MTALGCATIVSALIAVMHKDLIRSVAAYAVSSVCLAAIFFLLASPFAAALELTVGAGLVAVLFLVALGRMFFRPRLRIWATAFLVLLAVMTHYANSSRYAASWEVMRSFWWQVSWRAPQIEPGTTIVATYANQGVPEDYHIWGPANLIYYPARNTPTAELTDIEINGSTLTLGDVQNILSSSEFISDDRSFLTQIDFGNILVMTNPSASSCVHVLDGLSPDISEYDRSEVILIAERSNLDNILTNQEFQAPPGEVFGEEPEQTWCYYYQKASFARQQQDWEEILILEKMTQDMDFRPGDPVEWLPFLEANAMTGNAARVEDLSNVIKENRFTWRTTCKYYTQDLRSLSQENPEGYNLLFTSLCE